MFQPDPEVGYILKPRQTIKSEGSSSVVYYVGDRGIRVGSQNASLPNVVEILAVGCSQTYGQGLPYEKTFPEQIAKIIGVRVANLGVSGYGGLSSLYLAGRFRDLQPRVLVYGFWEDHLYRNLARCANSHSPYCISLPYFSCDAETCDRIREAENNRISMWLTERYVRDLGSGRSAYPFANDLYWTAQLLLRRVLLGFGLADRYVQVTDVAALRTSTKKFFSLLRKETETWGMKAIVVFIPYYFNDDIHNVPDYVIESALSENIPLVYLTDQFRDEVVRHPGSLAIPGDGHMTARAHRIVAEAVAKQIRALELLRESSPGMASHGS
jgi:hypothetical protein